MANSPPPAASWIVMPIADATQLPNAGQNGLRPESPPLPPQALPQQQRPPAPWNAGEQRAPTPGVPMWPQGSMSTPGFASWSASAPVPQAGPVGNGQWDGPVDRRGSLPVVPSVSVISEAMSS